MERSQDVLGEAASFRELLLPEPILAGLLQAGFQRPSPVQQQAIPLARLGADVIVQAKAGTGKTLVFAVAAAERADRSHGAPQVLVLAPTREIALQASEVVSAAAGGLPPPALSCGTFIGGLPIEEDEAFLRRHPCHVAVGTPGRVLALLQRGALPVSRIRLLALDEADKLLGGESFAEDVLAILGCLPERKQVLALSATYSEGVLQQLRGMMRKAWEVMLCSDAVSLLGIRQLYCEVPSSAQPAHQGLKEWQRQFEGRVAVLLRILSSVSFHQAVVFCNWRRDAEELAERLAAAGYPAAYLSAARAQLERIDALNALRDFRLRVAVTTDLAARGIDLDRVNLVVNLELPSDAATYMHRVGRAGRFGTRGVAVTLVAPGEREALEAYLQEAGGEIQPLPEHIPLDWYCQQPAASNGPSSSGGDAAANGRSCPEQNGAAAARQAAPEAAAASSGLTAAFSDVSTASLWYDAPGEALPSSPTWPPPEAAAQAQPPGAPAATALAAAAGEQAAAAGAPRPSSLLSGSLAGSLQRGGLSTSNGTQRSCTVLAPAALAAAAPGAQGGLPNGPQAALGPPPPPPPPPAQQQQEQAAGAGFAAVPAGPDAGDHASGSDSDETDSWASSSDDMLSSSEESDAMQQRLPGAAAGSSPGEGLLRVGSSSSIPMPQPRHHHHHPNGHPHAGHHRSPHRQPDGTLSAYVNQARRRQRSAGRAAAAAPGPGAVLSQPAAAAVGSAGSRAAALLQQEETEQEQEQEQEHSFRDSWLSGAVREAARQAAAATVAGMLGITHLELRPHSRQGDAGAQPPPPAPTAATSAAPADSGGSGGSSEAEASASRAASAAATTAAPAQAASGGGDGEGEGGRHYCLLVGSARADLLREEGAAEDGMCAEAARLLEQAFSAAAGGAAEAGAPAKPTAPATLAAAAAEQQQQQQQQQVEQAGADGLALPWDAAPRQRRPLGSAQVNAARRTPPQQAQRSAGLRPDADSLAAEAALLEAWAEESGSDEGAEGGGGEEGGWGEAELEGEAGWAAGGSEGGASGGGQDGNEEAWRQYWVQYYQAFGHYPLHLGASSPTPGPAAHPGGGSGAAGVPSAPTAAAAAAGPAPATPGVPPPPPPPPPPLHAMVGPAQLGAAPTVEAPTQADAPAAAQPPWAVDAEGYVRVPADLVRRYQEAEWRDWQQRYAQWCTAWEHWSRTYWASHSAQP